MVNAFGNLFHSRKFWLLVLDAVVSAVTAFVGWYVAPDDAEKVIFLIGAMQPVFVALIAGIAIEDAAQKRADGHRS